jgi:hypothetical protein
MSTHSQSHKNAQRRHGIQKREKILKMMTDNKQKGIYLTPEHKDRNFGYPIDGPNAAGLATAYQINNELFVNPMQMAGMEMDGLTFGGRNKRGNRGKSAKNIKRDTSYKRKSRRHKKNKNRSNKMTRKNKNRMSRKNKNRMSRKKKQL